MKFSSLFGTNLIYSGHIENNELVIVEMKLKNDKKLVITSVYVSPSIKLSIKALLKIKNLNDNYVTNRSGHILYKWLQDHSTQVTGSNEVTYVQGGYAEKLDWVLTDVETSLLYSHFQTHPLLGTTKSGHKPIAYIINCSSDSRLTECARQQYIFSQANCPLYHIELYKHSSQREPTEVTTTENLID
ncbi:unnamed protein product [Didymodactylos carnosus]|uniref:Uncharacterized protein n=1 Tax=Didymodactylos carnosus TaxID=1234261 RepID=A0A814ZPT9_9BILA|nr:unnamed protein product [Didymodactylos carnosus]CAF4009815.1 unnamed protein product [Didymodactylos carnosus]